MVRKSGTSAAVRSVARGAVGVLKLVNFEVQKVQNPNLFDSTVKQNFVILSLVLTVEKVPGSWQEKSKHNQA